MRAAILLSNLPSARRCQETAYWWEVVTIHRKRRVLHIVFKQSWPSLFSGISISIVPVHIFKRNHITIYFLILPYLFLILICFLSCFYNSFDHFGFPWDVYFLFFRTGLFILSYEAFNQHFQHNIYFAFPCSAHKGKHVRKFYEQNHGMWSREGPLREFRLSPLFLGEETSMWSTFLCYPLFLCFVFTHFRRWPRLSLAEWH